MAEIKYDDRNFEFAWAKNGSSGSYVVKNTSEPAARNFAYTQVASSTE